MQPILSISNLSKTYASGLQALKHVDLEIGQGEIFALLGPNGAGKTTLIHVICGIVTATEGTVVADGYDNVADYRAAHPGSDSCPRSCTPTPSNRSGPPSASAAGCSARPPTRHISKKC